MRQKIRRWAPYVTAALIVLALFLVAGVLRNFTWDQVTQSLSHLRLHNLILAGLYTIGSYTLLTGFDFLAVLYVGKPLPYRNIALAAFVSLSIGHTVGLAPLSSGFIRYRFYSRWGYTEMDVGKVIFMSALTVAIGELSLAGITLVASPDAPARLLHITPVIARLAGLACMLILLAYVVIAAGIRRDFRLWKWTFKLPSWRIALGQIVLGTADFACVVAALREVLSSTNAMQYPIAATAYLLGNFAALMSHIPGGIGVIEATIVALLPNSDVIGPVIAFRIIYFFGPLALGIILFIIAELARRRPPAVETFRGMHVSDKRG